MRVLVVEDQIKMAELLRRGLQRDGYAVDLAHNASDALWLGTENAYDVVVLDLMLLGGSGFDVCRGLREAGRWAPVIMLTARDAMVDRVAELDAGADDYLVKPFSFAELLARMRALLRRGQPPRPSSLHVGDLVLDPGGKR